MDFNAFKDKFNIVFNLYNETAKDNRISGLMKNDLEFALLREKTLDLIIEYRNVNDVDVKKCDDMKIKYFLSYALYEKYDKENNFINIGLTLLAQSWIEDTPVVINKIKKFLLEGLNIGTYYGKFGIYIIAKSIYYERTRCEKLIKIKPDNATQESIINNVIINNYGNKNTTDVSGNRQAKKTHTFTSLIISFFKNILK